MSMDKTGWVLSAVLARQARERPDHPFLQFRDDEPLTYAAVDDVADRVATGLARRGVQPGDHVAVMLDNSLEYAFAWFGISRLGAVHVAVNTALRGDFLHHVLTNSDAEVLIVAPAYLPRLTALEAHLPALRHVLVADGVGPPLQGEAPALQRAATEPFAALPAEPARPPSVTVRYRDLGAILYTSGTTGPAKGVLMPHAQLYLWGMTAVESAAMTAEDVYYICMPLFHANAMFIQLYSTLQAGARAVIVPGFSASRWIDDIRRHGATLTNLLGVMSQFVAAQPERPDDADNRLRLLRCAPCPRSWPSR